MDNIDIKLHYLNDFINIFKNNLDIINIDSVTMWSNTSWSVPSSSRSDFEVNYYIEGSAKVKLAKEDFTVNPVEIHFIDNSEGNFCENGTFKLVFFMFSVKNHLDSGRDVYLKIKDCFKCLSRIRFPGRKNFLENHYIDMIKENSIKKPGYKLKMKLSALQIFLEVFRTMNSHLRTDSYYKYSKYSEMVSEIISFLSEDFYNDVTLDDLGKKYNLNPRYLNRIFKGITGFPILQYRQRIKIDKAKRLLTSSSLSLLDIALELGFCSSQYLSRIFKKVTGLLPGKYRKS